MSNNIQEKPKTKDLDDFLKVYGKSGFLQAIKHAKSYTQFKIDNVLPEINFKSLEDKKKWVYILRPDIASLPSLLDRKEYIRLIANRLCLPEKDVEFIIKQKEPKVEPKLKHSLDKHILAQQYLIACFFSKFNMGQVLHHIETSGLKFQADYQQLYDLIKNKMLQAKEKNVIIEETQDEITNKQLFHDILFKGNEIDSYSEIEVFKFMDDNIGCINQWWHKELIRQKRQQLKNG